MSLNQIPYTNVHNLNLDWVLTKVREFDAKITEFQSVIDEFQEYVDILVNLDPRVTDLETDVRSLKQRISAVEHDISRISTALTSEINARIVNDSILQKQIDQIKNSLVDIGALYDRIKIYVDQSICACDSRTDSKIYNVYLTINEKFNTLMLYIEDIYDQLMHIAIDVFNWNAYAYAVNGRIPFDLNNKLLYQHLGNNLDSEQYCYLGLTAGEYAAFNLTADEYLMYSRDRLHYDYVYMPVSGKRQHTSVALSECINYVFNTLTAGEYAALDLTADDYAALNLSALEYLRMNSSGDLTQRVIHSSSGTGLTAGEYAHLTLI